MNYLAYIFANITQTLLRFLPFPTKTGLVKIGNPDDSSPVLLTGNFDLTVRRLKKALRGIDAWLLVANSHGINVWCAATGGHLGNHEVISVLKTSGIAKQVKHRHVILPQLAATGVEGKVIHKKTGWKVIWGPVYAESIPSFIDANYQKSDDMRKVKFPFLQRMEMAIMWTFPVSLILTPVFYFIDSSMLLPLNILIWAMAMSVYGILPWFIGLLKPQKQGLKAGKFSVFMDILKAPLFFWLLYMLSLSAWLWHGGRFNDTSFQPTPYLIKWGITSFILFFVLCMDLMGSTPLYKSGFLEDRFLMIQLDKKKCKGAGFCEVVCPKNCFDVDYKNRTASMPRKSDCVQCGACVVQCPFDALYFESPYGSIVKPQVIRQYKVNMLGRR